MLHHHHQATLLRTLEKAVTANTIADIVPEDLELQAHNTLWRDSDPTELTLMKLIPTVRATNVRHEYTRITSFGERRGSAFFSETALPPSTNFNPERVINNIRLLGEQAETFILAALEETQQALGTSGNVNIERAALRLNLLRKKNHALYFSDTRTIAAGDNGVRFKGLYQLIQEGTDGTTGESPYGTHVIDLEGQPLTAETLRDKVADIITLFGFISCLIMDPFVRAQFEASFDSAQRLEMPISLSPYVIGQQIAGLQTQGGRVMFHTDNTLTPIWRNGYGKYTPTAMEQAPSTTASGSTGSAAAGVSSKWDAASAGEIYYFVTTLKDELEGLGVRIPATPGTFITVAVGDEVTLSLQPGATNIDAWRIYRGTDADANEATGTDAYWIADVANAGGPFPQAFVDRNQKRPNTSTAFGLNIRSKAQVALNGGLANAYESAVERSASFMNQPDNPRNTIAVAELGPSMGILPLAHILAHVDRPLMYSACTPEVRNPFQNVVFENIGRA